VENFKRFAKICGLYRVDPSAQQANTLRDGSKEGAGRQFSVNSTKFRLPVYQAHG